MWGRHSEGPGITCIDYVFADNSAARAVQSMRLVRALPCPRHLGVEITINRSACAQKVRRWLRPRQYPVEYLAGYLREELETRGEVHAAAAEPGFRRAEAENDIGTMYRIASRGESFVGIEPTQVSNSRGACLTLVLVSTLTIKSAKDIQLLCNVWYFFEDAKSSAFFTCAASIAEEGEWL